MNIEIGVNSYMTFDEADSIVYSEYLPDEEERKLWDSLDAESKATLIIRGTRLIDSMHFIGVPITSWQKLSWPRRVWGSEVECPDDVKIALIKNILQEKKYSRTKEQQLQDLGVSTYKVKDASISFGTNGVLSGNAKIEGIYSNLYNTYLQNWVF